MPVGVIVSQLGRHLGDEDEVALFRGAGRGRGRVGVAFDAAASSAGYAGQVPFVGGDGVLPAVGISIRTIGVVVGGIGIGSGDVQLVHVSLTDSSLVFSFVFR